MEIKDEIIITENRGNINNLRIQPKVPSDRECCLCGSKETYKPIGGTPQWFRYRSNYDGEFDINGKPNGKYLCKICFNKQPGSVYDQRKSETKFRNKQISKDSNAGKGFIGEQIWCKTRGVKNCNIETNNFKSKIDASPDIEYGTVDTKIATFDYKYNIWRFNSNISSDTTVLFCIDKEWKNIERTYIIPTKDITAKNGISISLNSVKYEKYRVNENPYNEAYHNMRLKDCTVLKSEE